MRAAIVSSTSELMSGGTDSSTSDAPRSRRAATPPRRLPVKMPLGMPSSVATTSAAIASRAVFAARSRTSSMTGRWYWNDSPKSSVSVRSQPAGVLLGDRAIEAEPMPLGRDLLRRPAELRRIVARRELREQQRARASRRRRAAARQGRGGAGTGTCADYRSFRPFRPRELGRASSACRDDVERGGIPEDLRVEEDRHGAADAAAHRDRHLRRDEIDRRQVLAEDLLHLGEEPLPLGERRRPRPAAASGRRWFSPTAPAAPTFQTCAGAAAQPEVQVHRRIERARLEAVVDALVVALAEAREHRRRIERRRRRP